MKETHSRTHQQNEGTPQTETTQHQPEAAQAPPQYGIEAADAPGSSPASAGPVQLKGQLPAQLQAGVEALSGYSMSDVQVHYNSSKPGRVGALAYTQGSNIHVAPRQEKHLPHEAWHAVQQKQGRVRPNVPGTPINADRKLEREADTMGSKAERHSGESHSNLRQASADGDALQGRFGFELELTTVVESQQLYDDADNADDVYYDDPKLALKLTDEVTMAKGNGFKVNVDHQSKESVVGKGVVDEDVYKTGGAPIIELVTYPPIDEFEDGSEKQTRDLAKRLVATAKEMENSFGNRKKLKDFTGITGADDSIYVGGAKKGRQNVNSYTHATYGLKLNQLTGAFEETADRVEQQRGNVEKKLVKNLRDSAAGARTATTWVYNTYGPGDEYDLGERDDLAPMEGLFTLMLNYMISFDVGGKDKSLGKNLVGMFFYKSSLADVLEELPLVQADLLEDKRAKVFNKLKEIAETKRGRKLDKNINWQNWVRLSLRGKTDNLLEEFINPYSPKLGPENIGAQDDQSIGVVLENRMISKVIQGFGKKVRPENWEKMMIDVYNMLRGLNTTPES